MARQQFLYHTVKMRGDDVGIVGRRCCSEEVTTSFRTSIDALSLESNHGPVRNLGRYM